MAIRERNEEEEEQEEEEEEERPGTAGKDAAEGKEEGEEKEDSTRKRARRSIPLAATASPSTEAAVKTAKERERRLIRSLRETAGEDREDIFKRWRRGGKKMCRKEEEKCKQYSTVQYRQ